MEILLEAVPQKEKVRYPGKTGRPVGCEATLTPEREEGRMGKPS